MGNSAKLYKLNQNKSTIAIRIITNKVGDSDKAFFDIL